LLKKSVRKDYRSDSILPETVWKSKKIPLLNKSIQKTEGTCQIMTKKPYLMDKEKRDAKNHEMVDATLKK
jgi:hypothetical protein